LAKVVAKLKVFPSDVSISLEKLKGELKNALPSGVDLWKFEEEPIAFGLVALNVTVSMQEESGGIMDKVENALKSCKDVGEVQTIVVARM